MKSLCCKSKLEGVENSETSYLVCSQCGRPCDRVVNTTLLEILTDESIHSGIAICPCA